MFAQCRFVFGVIVRLVILPAAEEDALPFESQGSHGRVMRRAFGALLEIKRRGPAAPQDAFLGVFVKALSVELGAEIAPVDVATAAALFGDGRNAGVTLQLGGSIEAVALCPQAAEQTGAEHRAGWRRCAGRDDRRTLARSGDRSGQWSSARPAVAGQ